MEPFFDNHASPDRQPADPEAARRAQLKLELVALEVQTKRAEVEATRMQTRCAWHACVRANVKLVLLIAVTLLGIICGAPNEL